MTTAVEYRTGASLVDDETFGRFVLFLINDMGEDPRHAPGIVDQALAYFGTVAVHDGLPLMPSDAVDRGIYCVYLHTRDAAALFDRIAVRFLHHKPHPERGLRRRGQVLGARRRRGLAVRLRRRTPLLGAAPGPVLAPRAGLRRSPVSPSPDFPRKDSNG
ncbi:hypothetical protein [Streptomyces formicae]|uniref:Uncharacterized protein n=1 Tax=Streptomyces formicae TaxID=1616117 RepID=A0A291QAW1_9ACTN|nr:hypothetical protein [Streptomyces formicae]ATL28594.1 hypothetical protein KY5_3576 [Streptomyces formicae]